MTAKVHITLLDSFSRHRITLGDINATEPFDIGYFEREWRNWVVANDIEVKNPEAHFMAFVKQKVAK